MVARSLLRGPPERAGLHTLPTRRRLSGLFTVRAGCMLFLSVGCAADAGRGNTRHEPADGLPRLMTEAARAPDISMVVDFDALGDTLLLLERGAELNRFEFSGGAWNAAGRIAGPGAGPGELRAAFGVALSDEGIAVNDAVRAHFFDRAGRYRSSADLRPPCFMFQPRLAWSVDGVFLHGRCRRSGLTTDTMKAVLAFADDTASWRIVAEDVHYTSDGSTGSIFGPSHAFTPGPAHHLFGAAAEPCVMRIAADASAVTRVCGVAPRMYSADPPADVKMRTGRGPVRGMRVEWPDPLPAYIDRIATPHGDVLLRPYSADSLLLQLADGDHRDIAVLPVESLVGCKAVGCLWVEHQDVTRILLLTPDAVAALMAVRR